MTQPKGKTSRGMRLAFVAGGAMFLLAAGIILGASTSWSPARWVLAVLFLGVGIGLLVMSDRRFWL